MTAGEERPDATWAQAREASQQMILQAAMEDVESKANKLEDELRVSMQKNEQQAGKLTNMRSQVDQLEATLETKSSKLQAIQSDYQNKVSACERLEESERDKRERFDRGQLEADALREEIR
jgi:chromosome segregation ATPase